MRASRASVNRPDAGDVEALVTELQVHHVELEIQNEELRGVQADLAHARTDTSSSTTSPPWGI